MNEPEPPQNEDRRTNLAEITSGPLKSVADIIDVAETWPEPIPGYPNWPLAFRGQPHEYGALTPSFQRQFTSKSLGAAEIIERRLIEAFRKHYASLPEQSLGMPSASMIGASRDVACLSLMQHYEIPTRLLDWTGNCWIATYFACASDPGDNAELWVYDRQIFSMQGSPNPDFVTLTVGPGQPEPPILTRRPEETIIEFDPRSSPRMIGQFAHHTVSTSVFSDHAPLLSALNQTSQTVAKYPLTRFIIHSSCKGKVLQFLAEQKDVTAGTVFPDLVGLGRFLRWQFDSLRTMLL